MKRQREVSADTRTRILDAAEEMFAESGYNGSSTAGIAKKAKVPKGLVFHYFPQKMDVLTALIDERTFVEVLPDVETMPGDPAGALSRLARRVPLRGSPPIRRLPVREADTHHSAGERLRRVNTEIVRRAHSALELTLPGARGDAARLEVA